MAKTSAEAWVICWYSLNQPANSATSDGVSLWMADSISTTVLMQTKLPWGTASGKPAERCAANVLAGEDLWREPALVRAICARLT